MIRTGKIYIRQPSDERYLHMAEDNLFGELAIPFEMTKGEAEAYFISKVSMV